METIFNSPGKFKSQFAMANGIKTHYLEAGREDADRVLLVHGRACEIGMGCHRWYPNIIPLSKHFHVYAIDVVGHGFSDPPKKLEDLGLPRVRAEHVIDFIDALKLGPINLVGQSQGGWIVTYITIKRPDLVKRLVLIDSGSTSGAALKTDERSKETDVEIDGIRVPVGSGELPYMKEIFERNTMMPKEGLTTTREGVRKYVGSFFYDKSMVTEEYLDHLMELSKKWNDLYMKYRGKEYWRTHTLKQSNEEHYVDGVHIREWVKTIRTPTLVIWGKNSNKGVDPGVELYKKIPDAQMHIFDKANHFLWLDQWKDFNSLVTWFLTKDRAGN